MENIFKIKSLREFYSQDYARKKKILSSLFYGLLLLIKRLGPKVTRIAFVVFAFIATFFKDIALIFFFKYSTLFTLKKVDVLKLLIFTMAEI